MLKFREDFNCCKTVSCKNFGVVNSPDYIYKSERLGYWSTECKACGSNSPWIKNTLVNSVFKEKLGFYFGRKFTGCPCCSNYFFISEDSDTKRYGFTSAGRQRKQCRQCGTIFTPPYIKNNDALKCVLAIVLAKKDIRTSLKKSGLSARLYYFYLDKLALIFSNFSRLHEEKVSKRKQLTMHSEGKLLAFANKKGIYSLITSEVESGYILQQTNNLTQQVVSDYYNYDEKHNTIITTLDSINMENILLNRYQQNMKRNHFEQLLVGELKPLPNSYLIYPDKLAYIHFQLLNVFTQKVDHYTHYIEHESCFRSAALMASYPDIIKGGTAVYFFVPSVEHLDSLQGKELGWWKDRWFSNQSGAYSAIVPEIDVTKNFKRPMGNSIALFTDYLDKQLNKNVNSVNVVNNLLEIYRVLFNYCELKKGQTRAMEYAVSDKKYMPESLLEEALQLFSVR